jgi:prepilin-type N-terminal cleavage/methylation domain-containing protein
MRDRERAGRKRSRQGFTFIETVIAIAILGTVFGSIYAMLRTTSRSFTVASASTRLDTQVSETLDKIAELLRASKLSTVTPQPVSPFSSSVINFQRSVGYAAGATVWGNQERIALVNGNVVWTQNVGLLSQTSKILTHNVPTYLQGEVANVADDNRNGLIDEAGLCFDVAGTAVNVRLTLQVRSSAGQVLAHTKQQEVFLRNR